MALRCRNVALLGSVRDDTFDPVNHGCGETHCFPIFLCGYWLKRPRIAGLKGVPGQYDSLFDKGWYEYAMVFQTFAQFFEVVRIAEQEPSVLVDRLEGFLCGLLSEETLIFPESTCWLVLLCKSQMAFGTHQPVLYTPWNGFIG